MMDVQKCKDQFPEFLLAEYQNLANAHFKSIDSISQFIRYLILVMSIPFPAAALLFNKKEITSIFIKHQFPIALLFLALFLVGLSLLIYVIYMRYDALLYARAINGVRKYFFDQSELGLNYKNRIRQLPVTTSQPHYFEWRFFFSVVLLFSIFNTIAIVIFIRMFLSCQSVWSQNTIDMYAKSYPFDILCLIPIILLFHLALYIGCSWRKEYEYTKSNIIGVDIDGVLNKHREHFCNIFEKKYKREINPDKLDTMPVNYSSQVNISKPEERSVFNDPNYWVDMPQIESAASVLSMFKNVFHIDIQIFTYRSWPDCETKDELKQCLASFSKRAGTPVVLFLYNILSFFFRNPGRVEFLQNLKRKPIHRITKRWLDKNGIPYGKLQIEFGNDYTTHTGTKIMNRFTLSKRRKIKYFVEDDLQKAIKLSFICDIVFLISHPYNQPQDHLSDEENKKRSDLPTNVIIVEGWKDIESWMKKLA